MQSEMKTATDRMRDRLEATQRQRDDLAKTLRLLAARQRGMEQRVTDLEDALLDCVLQSCGRLDYLDSMAISAYADALRVLADVGRVKILSAEGRRVIARVVRHARVAPEIDK